MKGEQLCVSLLFDSQFEKDDVISDELSSPSSHSFPGMSTLKDTVSQFKETLNITSERCHEIERNTREQRNSELWYSVRKYSVTSSLFGAIFSRKPDTPPHSFVFRTIQPKSLSTPAINYGINNEKRALNNCFKYQHSLGKTELVVTSSGVIINPSVGFLGASPDEAVYDPSNLNEPYGFLEIKCPYTCRNVTPMDACGNSGSYCSTSGGRILLKETHSYYAQVQGQMAIGEHPWCEFVVFRLKGNSVQHIAFNQEFWTDILSPKLSHFYDNCAAPELVSPVHVLDFPFEMFPKKKILFYVVSKLQIS